MNIITTPPPFHNGLATICNLKSFCHQIDCFARGETNKLREVICSPHFEFSSVARRLNREINSLPSISTEAGKIREIWNRFYELANEKSPNPQELSQRKVEIEGWVRSFEAKPTGENSLPGSAFVAALEKTAAVVSDKSLGQSPILPHNFIFSQEIPKIEKNFQSFLSHVEIEGKPEFQEQVQKLLQNLQAYKAGRSQIAMLLQEIGTKSVKLQIKPGTSNSFSRVQNVNRSGQISNEYIIHLSLEPTSNVMIDPETKERRSVYFSDESVLFHELQHFFNYLKEGGPSSKTSLNVDCSVYTNIEEGRVILGSPSLGFLSENLLRKHMGLSDRYGHIAGCDFSNPHASLGFAVLHNLVGDFKWILPALSSHSILAEISKQKTAVRSKFHQNSLVLDQLEEILKVNRNIFSKVLQQGASVEKLYAVKKDCFSAQNETITKLLGGSFISKQDREHIEGVCKLESYHQDRWFDEQIVLKEASSSISSPTVKRSLASKFEAVKDEHKKKKQKTDENTPPAVQTSSTSSFPASRTPGLSIQLPLSMPRTPLSFPPGIRRAVGPGYEVPSTPAPTGQTKLPSFTLPPPIRIPTTPIESP